MHKQSRASSWSAILGGHHQTASVCCADRCASQGLLRDTKLPSFRYLARSPGSNAAPLFTMHELPSGYNFVPLLQEPAGSLETNDPGQVIDWKKSTFQYRAVKSFVHADQRYGLVVAVDGQALCAQHYSNLRRRGRSSFV